MARHLRFKKLNNWNVQGPIVIRLLLHFVAYNAATLFLMMTVWGIRTSLAAMAEPSVGSASLTFWQQAAPVMICMFVMTPFMIWDLIKLTNRISGPLYRFECLMKEFVASGTLPHATLRNKDLLMDFQRQFNEFTDALHALYPETKPTPAMTSGGTPTADATPEAVHASADVGTMTIPL